MPEQGGSWWPWAQDRGRNGAGRPLRLVAGLGNPGRAYAETPHNVGFKVVELLAEQWQCPLRRSWRWRAMIGKSERRGRPVWLMQPLSYMNNSGVPVRAVMRANGVPLENLIVVLDDADLPLGQIRVRASGSDGGHRGLRSLVSSLGAAQFARVRLGVCPAERPADLVKYVLSNFAAADRALVDKMIALAAAAVERILDDGVAAAMNAYNGLRVSAS